MVQPAVNLNQSHAEIRYTRYQQDRWRDCHQAFKTSSYEQFKIGLHLEDAPEIEEEHFVGRVNELGILKDYLLSDDARSRRKIFILFGPGGMGKTQLAIKFAKRHQKAYLTIFWLNTKNEEILKRSLASMASRVLKSESLPQISGV